MRVTVFFVALCLTTPLISQVSQAAPTWGLYSGTHISYSHEGDSIEDTYQVRSVGTFDLQALPGVRLSNKMILVGLLFDFRLFTQLSDTGGSIGNFSGTGLTIGPGAELNLSTLKLVASWDWRDRQGISTPSGTLEGSGFHFILGYKALPAVWLDLEYVISRYKTLSLSGVESDLSASPVTQNNVGVGISISL